MTTQWKIALWTPGHAPADDGHTFGCASHGIAALQHWSNPEANDALIWPTRVSGNVLAGRYADVLARLAQLPDKPHAAVVLFAHATGMESFLIGWHELFPEVPVAGGAAARSGGKSCGELLPAAEDVAVLLINQGAWRAESLNAHDGTGTVVDFRPDGPRTIVELRQSPDGNWEPAAAFFRARQAQFGASAGDCESVTLSDANGRNLHVSVDGERLQTGANLPVEQRLVLRAISRAEVAKRLGHFCAKPGALVFGCAGLRGLLDGPISPAAGALAGFMFGELVILGGIPQFGNLMAARLSPERE